MSTPLTPRGADVTDVHLAAVLKRHGVRTLSSRDARFRRFDFLDAVNPFASATK